MSRKKNKCFRHSNTEGRVASSRKAEEEMETGTRKIGQEEEISGKFSTLKNTKKEEEVMEGTDKKAGENGPLEEIGVAREEATTATEAVDPTKIRIREAAKVSSQEEEIRVIKEITKDSTGEKVMVIRQTGAIRQTEASTRHVEMEAEEAGKTGVGEPEVSHKNRGICKAEMATSKL